MDHTLDAGNPLSISDKLSAPKKISQFEKIRNEEKQKRLRHDEELRQALGEYEDDFEEDASRRQYDGRPGVGRFDQGHVSGPPPSMKRKREMQLEAERRERSERDNMDEFGRTQSRRSLSPTNSDDDNALARRSKRRSPEPSFRKPTMLVQSLPKSATEEDVRKVMPVFLKVEDIRLFSPTDRHDAQRYMSAYVSASMSTPTSELDKAVSQVQDKYLGFGCYIKASRHVASSGKLGNIDTSILGLNSKTVFGATQMPTQDQLPPSYRDAAPQSMNRMPPPSTFAQASPAPPKPAAGPLAVSVTIPTDLKLLALINSTAEQVIQHGPDFEALLMSQPSVQKDERWAWLFESTSKASVYYRWLLWDGLAESDLLHPEYTNVFDSGPMWKAPGQPTRYTSVLGIEDICQDLDYISSDEDDSEDDGQQRDKPKPPGRQVMSIDEVGEDSQAQYLNPGRRAKLTYLLARIPESIGTLRCGDVARVSHFVVNNAGNGAEEIIDMLISNLEHPFRYSVKYMDEEEPVQASAEDGKSSEEVRDQSGSQLIALYVISDILLASSTAGVSNAWKYRNLLETALLDRQVFERLGHLEKVYKWGRMKSEQWKRKILVVLDLWTDRSVFNTETLKQMRSALMEPPMTAGERAEKAEEAKSKWLPAITAATKEAPAEDIKADVARRVAAMQANIAASKAKAAGDKTAASDQTSSPSPAAPAPLEKQSSGGFSFALGGGASASPAPAKPGGGIGFSIKPAPTAAPSSSTKGVFGDDDSD